MKGYSETEVFSPEEKRYFAEAKKLVRHLPARDSQDRWVRCHEVARVVGAVLGLEVCDGHYGMCEHSWLWLSPLTPLSSPPNILDPYVVGRLPSVQIVRSSTSCPYEYRRGDKRRDIRPSVLEELYQRCRGTIHYDGSLATMSPLVKFRSLRLVPELPKGRSPKRGP